MLLMDAFWCLIKHPLAPLGTAVLILEEVPKKRPLCRSGTMLLLLYVSIGAKRADFGTISRFVNFLIYLHDSPVLSADQAEASDPLTIEPYEPTFVGLDHRGLCRQRF
jgi:hypothetical protein